MALADNGSGSHGPAAREYTKPLLVAIDLKAEEVLGYGCKTVLVPLMPNIGDYPACGITQGCVQEAS